MSRYERWLGATMNAPSGGTCSVPLMRIRNSELAQPEQQHPREPVQHQTLPPPRPERSHDLGDDVARASGRSCRTMRRAVRGRERRRRAARVRGVAARAIAACSASTVTRDAPRPPRRAGAAAPAPRRDAVRNTFTARIGEHDRADVAALHHAAAVRLDPRPLTGDQLGPHRGVRRRPSTPRPSPRARGSPSRRRAPSSVVTSVAHLDVARHGAIAPATSASPGSRPGPQHRAASPRGTSRRCRARRSPSAPATPRPIVDLPEPDGPSIATIRFALLAIVELTSAPTRGRLGEPRVRDRDRRRSRAPSSRRRPPRPATAAAIAMRWSPWLFSARPGGAPPWITKPSGRASTPMPSWVSSCSSVADAVALLHRELGRVVNRRHALGERGRDREHRQLVDDRLVARDLGAVQRRRHDRACRRPARRPRRR